MTASFPRATNGSSAGNEQEAIAGWLLRGPVQLRTGRHAGAVAGLIDDENHVQYVYPEITGYYLQWLAWRATRVGPSAELSANAAAAQQWLARWLDDSDPPQTRVHLDGASDDWRNGAVFCFDLAMVLRGVASAVRLSLVKPDPHVIAGVCRALRRLIGSDGLFNACVLHDTKVMLPVRWSTRRGGFLAKAAAGIMAAGAVLPGVDPDVRKSAEDTYSESLHWAVESPHDDVHALMYTFEGILSLPHHPQFASIVPALAAQFSGLLAEVRALGWVPESRRNAMAADAPRRLDVVAQMIRAGHLLGAYPSEQPPDRIGLERLRQMLVRHVRADGSLPFAVQSPPSQCNVWAAMFAEQALSFMPRPDESLSAADLGSLLA